MNNTEQTASFSGPFFVTGMPRSGTKLIAGLLDQHPSLGIPHRETTFLALWIRRFKQTGDISNRKDFKKFYDWTVRLPYFSGMESDGFLIGMDEWYNSCSSYSVQGVFKALVRHDARIDQGSESTWGSRSPAHIRQIPMLRSFYSDCRIIHIVRDVRDYCVSMKKAWGKHPLRSAQRWRNDVLAAREHGMEYPDSYLEIRYEDLLENPKSELSRVCSFLGVCFNPVMLQLKRPVESAGDAKGQRGIIASNRGKYSEFFGSSDIEKIEQIAKDALLEFGYEVAPETVSKRLGPLRMKFYKMLDAASLLRTSTAKTGFRQALRESIDSVRMNRS